MAESGRSWPRLRRRPGPDALLGWWVGATFAGRFQQVDHWIAFALLTALGLRMLMEVASNEEDRQPAAHGRLFGLMIAAFATSVDAAAAGLTLPLLDIRIPLACLMIGATTAILCTFGYRLGSRASARMGRSAELLGGLVLIGLGIKILAEHLGH